MAKEYLIEIDLNQNELQNAVIHKSASDVSSPVEGQLYYNTTNHTLVFYNGTAFIVLGKLNQTSAPAADLDLNSFKIINLANGSANNDAVNYSQLTSAVNSALAGLSWKQAVRAATTAAGTLASSFENGDTVDGVVLATGDRILIKNQAAGAENGIYTVNASGVPTRSTDADTGAELVNAAVFVSEGTTNADTGWTCTNNATPTLGSTVLVFAQFNGSSFTAGTGISIAANVISIDTAVVVRKYATDVGNGSSTSITVTHNLGTKDVVARVHDNTTPFAEVEVEVRKATTNTVTLIFAVAPTTNQYRCLVQG